MMALQAVSEVQPVWLQEVLNSYATDPKAQQLLAQLAIHSPDDSGFSLHQNLIRHKEKVWIGDNSALQTKLIAAFHSSAIGGHSGTKATYHRLKNLFAWKGMKQDVDNFIKQCSICQQAKHINALPAGLLAPLPIPDGAWEQISMDFIEGLPKSDGYSSILVVVDRFRKYAHFIPLKHPFTTAHIAKVVLDNVVKLHGLPLSIVTDRDKIFISGFWKELFKLYNINLQLSTAYHPKPMVKQSGSINVSKCSCDVLSMTPLNSGILGYPWLNFGIIPLFTLLSTALLSKHCMAMMLGWGLLLVLQNKPLLRCLSLPPTDNFTWTR